MCAISLEISMGKNFCARRQSTSRIKNISEGKGDECSGPGRVSHAIWPCELQIFSEEYTCHTPHLPRPALAQKFLPICIPIATFHLHCFENIGQKFGHILITIFATFKFLSCKFIQYICYLISEENTQGSNVTENTRFSSTFWTRSLIICQEGSATTLFIIHQ